jgi:hypothetical protein
MEVPNHAYGVVLLCRDVLKLRSIICVEQRYTQPCKLRLAEAARKGPIVFHTGLFKDTQNLAISSPEVTSLKARRVEIGECS